MKKEQKDILKLQKIDPLSVAEELTGKDYKTSKQTESLGFLLHIKKGEEMRRMLAEVGDTQFSNTVADYLRIATGFGFKVVYTEHFIYKARTETMYILFMEELGIILHFDSFGKNVNGGKFYYNWSPNNQNTGLTSSGHWYFGDKNNKEGHIGLFERDLITPYKISNYPNELPWNYKDMEWSEYNELNAPILAERRELFDLALKCGKRMLWIGDHDCREALITTIKAMWENGKFFPVWHDCQFPWLTHFAEHKSEHGYTNFESYYKTTFERMAKMPPEVQRCINGTYRPT